MDRSYMVGDKPSDLKAAINAKVGHKIMVRTGKPITDAGIERAGRCHLHNVQFCRCSPSQADFAGLKCFGAL
jgi:D-glycero-D-manno-heptose 1,7-bisphosphate phosphatase